MVVKCVRILNSTKLNVCLSVCLSVCLFTDTGECYEKRGVSGF